MTTKNIRCAFARRMFLFGVSLLLHLRKIKC